MDVTPLIPEDRQVIDGYRAGEFQVSQQVYHGPILVFPDRTVAWEVTAFTDFTPDSFTLVKAAYPDVQLLLIGSGAKPQLFPSRLRQDLRAAGIVVEVMDTGAACRTYNVLLSEGRQVAAALLPV